jgi:hypothetical protein
MRSYFSRIRLVAHRRNYGQMAELVDAQVSKTCALRGHAGSIPALATKIASHHC